MTSRQPGAEPRIAEGDDAGIDAAFTHAYDALHELARRQRRRWNDDHTLNTTVLLHEAYLKLAAQDRVHVVDRGHFFALVARAMRHILCNYARDRRALKRGGGIEPLPLDERGIRAVHAAGHRSHADADESDELIALDEALTRLEKVDARQSRVVECRFFAGLTVEETAAALGLSTRTVKRDWALAQAWLHRELTSARRGAA